ncbi:head-tail connector protein [Oricola thermophila]|uniref:Phage head-tail connector protein n=1 Tax=Oricola thermophila TaxID=2742145 RepID=A0A6N1VCP9_9HYPH|nr:phage head-tail connector protein [Oricola thermophila]QKV18634.1 phage head-tail connector protein [Oricola thermophila]
MTYALIAPPAAMPVTLAQAKAHLRVTSDTEDDAISALVIAATQYLERDTGQALIDQTWRAYFDCPPDDCVLQLLRAPVRRIVAVTVYDGAGNPAVLDGSDYFVNLVTRPARLRLADGITASMRANGIEVDFEAGYGATGVDVPDMLKRAVLVLVAHWYEFRGVYDAADQPVSVPALYGRLTRHFRFLSV